MGETLAVNIVEPISAKCEAKWLDRKPGDGALRRMHASSLHRLLILCISADALPPTPLSRRRLWKVVRLPPRVHHRLARIQKAYAPRLSAICRLLPHKAADPLSCTIMKLHTHSPKLCVVKSLTANLVEQMSSEHGVE